MREPSYLVSSIAAVALSLYAASAAQSKGPSHSQMPDFMDYPSETPFSGAPAAPRFQIRQSTWPQDDPKFREAVSNAARGGPNFAGAFMIVEISCGSGCLYMAIVDERDGSIFNDMPFSSLVVGSDLARGGRSLYLGLKYQRNSRLLIAEGWFNGTSGVSGGTLERRYYLWTGNRFRLLKSTQIRNRDPLPLK